MSDSQHSFAVRQAVAADIPLLAHHRAAMFCDMGQLAPHRERALEAATAAYLREAMPRGEDVAWVAENSGSPSVVGGAGAQIRAILPRPRPGVDDFELGPEAIVLNVYVEPAWRRRGVADALMGALLDGLAARGIRRIVLHASNDCERLGFVATNEMRLAKP